MKKIMKILLPLFLAYGSLQADNRACLEVAVDEMNDYYRTGAGCEDGVYNAISSSMIGWGIGLFAGIALLTGLVHNSRVHSSSSNPNTNN